MLTWRNFGAKDQNSKLMRLSALTLFAFHSDIYLKNAVWPREEWTIALYFFSGISTNDIFVWHFSCQPECIEYWSGRCVLVTWKINDNVSTVFESQNIMSKNLMMATNEFEFIRWKKVENAYKEINDRNQTHEFISLRTNYERITRRLSFYLYLFVIMVCKFCLSIYHAVNQDNFIVLEYLNLSIYSACFSMTYIFRFWLILSFRIDLKLTRRECAACIEIRIFYVIQFSMHNHPPHEIFLLMHLLNRDFSLVALAGSARCMYDFKSRYHRFQYWFSLMIQIHMLPSCFQSFEVLSVSFFCCFLKSCWQNVV